MKIDLNDVIRVILQYEGTEVGEAIEITLRRKFEGDIICQECFDDMPKEEFEYRNCTKCENDIKKISDPKYYRRRKLWDI